MIINDIIEGSLVDGDGLRTVIFFQSCPRICPGCQNPSLQPYEGKEISPKRLFRKLESVINKAPFDIDGISLSGGDPLYQNTNQLTEFLKLVKQKFDYSIWCWTGYYFDEIKHNEYMNYLDVIIDGPYDETQPNTKKHRGSDNQIMYVKRGKEWTKKN